MTAGMDALSELSMINPPGHPIMVIDRNKLNKEQIEVIKNKDLIKDTKLVELELWDYDPGLFSNNSHVDLLSLYAIDTKNIKKHKNDVFRLLANVFPTSRIEPSAGI